MKSNILQPLAKDTNSRQRYYQSYITKKGILRNKAARLNGNGSSSKKGKLMQLYIIGPLEQDVSVCITRCQFAYCFKILIMTIRRASSPSNDFVPLDPNQIAHYDTRE